jgi:hypothetical protein
MNDTQCSPTTVEPHWGRVPSLCLPASLRVAAAATSNAPAVPFESVLVLGCILGGAKPAFAPGLGVTALRGFDRIEVGSRGGEATGGLRQRGWRDPPRGGGTKRGGGGDGVLRTECAPIDRSQPLRRGCARDDDDESSRTCPRVCRRVSVADHDRAWKPSSREISPRLPLPLPPPPAWSGGDPQRRFFLRWRVPFTFFVGVSAREAPSPPPPSCLGTAGGSCDAMKNAV